MVRLIFPLQWFIIILLFSAPALGERRSSRLSTPRPHGVRLRAKPSLVKISRLPGKVRPTPTAPKMSFKELKRMGVDVYQRRGLSSKNPKLVFIPSKTRFDSKAARDKGLIAVKRSGKRSFLRTLVLPNRSGPHARPALYPRRPKAISNSFTAPARGKVKVAFFDADSTLRVSRSGTPSADSANDLALLPMVASKMKEMARQGYLIALVSNQAGVKEGYITRPIADSALRNTCRLLSKQGTPVHYYDFAEKYDGFRKPKTGMADLLARTIRTQLGRRVDWKNSIMVGDSGWKRGVDIAPDGKPGKDFSNSDRRFAESLRHKYRSPQGIKFHHPRDFFGWAAKGVTNFRSLAEVKDFMKKQPN